jgi:hypothetical protein
MAPYTQNMVQFFAMPGSSGKVRIKVQKPSDAEEVMIRRKLSAWAPSDTKDTGTLVATITDDSNYKDANEWYEATGLSDGTAYYFKAFPYKGGSYNETIGANETICKAGGLVSEYSFDSVGGNTVNDTAAGLYNMTTASGASIGGKIGNAMQFNGSSAYGTMNKSACPSGAKTIIASLKYEGGIDPAILWDGNSSGTYNANVAMQFANSNGSIMCAAHSGSVYTYNIASDAQVPNDGAFHMISHTFTGDTSANGAKLYIDNVLHGSATSSSPTSITATADIYLNKYANFAQNSNLKIDQLRFFNRVLESYELANIYNGGAGC